MRSRIAPLGAHRGGQPAKGSRRPRSPFTARAQGHDPPASRCQVDRIQLQLTRIIAESSAVTHSNESCTPSPFTRTACDRGVAPLAIHRGGPPSRARGNRDHLSPMHEGRAPSNAEASGGPRSAPDHDETHRRIDGEAHRGRATKTSHRPSAHRIYSSHRSDAP